MGMQERWPKLERALYGLRRTWRWVRVQRPVSLMLGPQYVRSASAIDLDITYECTLRCRNCNRSCRQAPGTDRMSVGQVTAFLQESKRAGQPWSRVRITGGEPTLHPEFLPLVWHVHGALAPSGTVVQVLTNGANEVTRQLLRELPPGVEVHDQRKTSPLQPLYRPFNMAPVDDRAYAFAQYRNGCHIAQDAMGLTPYGYYFCPVAGAIDRVLGAGLGRASLPEPKDRMLEQAQVLCRYCGHFRDGHHVPYEHREPLINELISPAWERLYAKYRNNPPRLRRYAEHAGPAQSE